jgi:hypothetical protein
MNRDHARLGEVELEIEKLVDARGMTHDGASSPITVFIQSLLSRLSLSLHLSQVASYCSK